MVTIPLLLMGCGGVGWQLLHHVISCRPLHSRQGLMLRVVGVCDSTSMVAIPDVLTSEFRDDFLLKLCEIKSNGSSFLDLTDNGECQVYSGDEIGRKVNGLAAALRDSNGLALVAAQPALKLLDC